MRNRCRLGLHTLAVTERKKREGCEFSGCEQVFLKCVFCPKAKIETWCNTDCNVHMDFFGYLTTRGM